MYGSKQDENTTLSTLPSPPPVQHPELSHSALSCWWCPGQKHLQRTDREGQRDRYKLSLEKLLILLVSCLNLEITAVTCSWPGPPRDNSADLLKVINTLAYLETSGEERTGAFL